MLQRSYEEYYPAMVLNNRCFEQDCPSDSFYGLFRICLRFRNGNLLPCGSDNEMYFETLAVDVLIFKKGCFLLIFRKPSTEFLSYTMCSCTYNEGIKDAEMRIFRAIEVRC